MKKTKITYRVLNFTSRFTCIDYIETVSLFNIWTSGGLLYGYKDRYNIVTIEKDMIVEMEV